MRTKVFNALTIIISLVALVFSWLSWSVSKQTFDYEVEKDSITNTPAITETADSTKINFALNSGAQLQSLTITFPRKVDSTDYPISAKPIVLSRAAIEDIAKGYLSKKVTVADSFATVGHFSLPVMLNYSAIVFGEAHFLRENRLFLFEINFYDDIKNVRFLNSFLVSRHGYPLQRHYFITTPFSQPLDEKVLAQDKLDVEYLLNNQLIRASQSLEN